MAALSGKSGAVTIAAGEVNGIDKWTLKYTADTKDVTDFQSDGVSEFIGTITKWSGSFSGKKDGAPAAITPATTIALVLKESDTGGQLWSGSAIITGVSADTSFDGVVTYSYDYQGTGVLTVATA